MTSAFLLTDRFWPGGEYDLVLNDLHDAQAILAGLVSLQNSNGLWKLFDLASESLVVADIEVDFLHPSRVLRTRRRVVPGKDQVSYRRRYGPMLSVVHIDVAALVMPRNV